MPSGPKSAARRSVAPAGSAAGRGPRSIGQTSDEVLRAAGQILIVGLEGVSLSAAEAAWLARLRPGGVILFRRNLEEPRQAHALLRAAEEAGGGEPLVRAIDLEGGSVDRLRDLIAPLPSAAAVARARDAKLAESGFAASRFFETQGWLAGRELGLLGFNVDFAPVLDLKTETSAPVMESRVHSADPACVAACAERFLDGLNRARVLGCGKHFPGLGGGGVDSHQSTPRIEKSFAALWREDLLPYRKLAARLPLVMISHAAYPQTLSAAEPASVSRYWITEILRKKLGFRGLAVSDDMEMGGILSQASIGEAAVRALVAGTQMIEICRQPELIFAAYEALVKEAEGSPAFARRLRRAAAEVERFKAGHFKGRRPFPPPPTAGRIVKLRTAIARFTASIETTARRMDAAPFVAEPLAASNTESSETAVAPPRPLNMRLGARPRAARAGGGGR